MHTFLIATAALLGLSAATPAGFQDLDWATTDSKHVNYTRIFEPGLSPGASIHYPNQPGYNTSVLERASLWEPPTFAVTIKPAIDSDVQHIVKIANNHNLDFFATGGAHGAEIGFGTVNKVVNIDLSNFIQNEVNAKENTLTVGPGVAFVDFMTDLYNAGKIIPVGNADCVNMIGATIGAGVGPFEGMHGLVIDSLMSVRLIDSTGALVTASDSENSDLFWAIKGAGANFGIITSATYRVYDVVHGGSLVGANYAYAGSQNLSLWKLLESFDTTWPKQMGMTVAASYNHTINESAILVETSFLGTMEEAKPIIDQFLALKPIEHNNLTTTWNNVNATEGFGGAAAVAATCDRGTFTNHYAIGMNKTDPMTFMKVFNEFAEFAKPRPWYTGFLAIQKFNTSANLAVPKDKQGVYPGRAFSTLFILENFYEGNKYNDQVYKFSKPVRDQLAKTSGFGKLETYINYAFGDEGPDVWYGKDNLPRLVALKKKWDPHNRFGPGNPIPESL